MFAKRLRKLLTTPVTVGNFTIPLQVRLVSCCYHSHGCTPSEMLEQIQSIDHAAETLNQLCQTGIHISLDDFGVGYSSLNYLSNLPVDIIKIDRSLTTQILTSEKQ